MNNSRACKNRLLLLDLDGVTVVGECKGAGKPEELRLLHPELPGLLAENDLEIILFTHRAFADAKQIQIALQQMGVPILHCVSAREMLWSALKRGRFSELLSHGLSKKFGVASVLEQFDITRSKLIMIDDRPEILKDVLAEGIGLGLLAPFDRQSKHLISFDFASALELMERNPKKRATAIALDPVKKQLCELPIIISITGSRVTSVSLFVRQLIRKTRQLVKKTRG